MEISSRLLLQKHYILELLSTISSFPRAERRGKQRDERIEGENNNKKIVVNIKRPLQQD